MTCPEGSTKWPVQPALSELLAGYLQEQVSRQAAGLAGLDSMGEVVPYESVPVQPVDARMAWGEAVAVARYFQAESKTATWLVPPDWAAIVSSQEPSAAISFSFGNYPQLVRNLHALLHATGLSALLPAGVGSPLHSSLREWAGASTRERHHPQVLLGVGVLRLARQFDAATELLNRHRANTPADWQAAWANEEAALAWHQGQLQEAADLWQKQASSIPVLFNRGMSTLFLGNRAEARPLLTKAVSQLSEQDGWHHLGRLYLALAELL
jgi:tetratricopeptide (TPR) repeat protein